MSMKNKGKTRNENGKPDATSKPAVKQFGERPGPKTPYEITPATEELKKYSWKNALVLFTLSCEETCTECRFILTGYLNGVEKETRKSGKTVGDVIQPALDRLDDQNTTWNIGEYVRLVNAVEEVYELVSEKEVLDAIKTIERVGSYADIKLLEDVGKVTDSEEIKNAANEAVKVLRAKAVAARNPFILDWTIDRGFSSLPIEKTNIWERSLQERKLAGPTDFKASLAEYDPKSGKPRLRRTVSAEELAKRRESDLEKAGEIEESVLSKIKECLSDEGKAALEKVSGKSVEDASMADLMKMLKDGSAGEEPKVSRYVPWEKTARMRPTKTLTVEEAAEIFRKYGPKSDEMSEEPKKKKPKDSS